MSSRNRKYDSGAEKRKKKQRLDAAAQSQRGALHRFFVKENLDPTADDGHTNVIEEVQANAVEGDDAVEANVDEGQYIGALDVHRWPAWRSAVVSFSLHEGSVEITVFQNFGFAVQSVKGSVRIFRDVRGLYYYQTLFVQIKLHDLQRRSMLVPHQFS
uniref:Uncharacterized protein n=1 Tax=Oryza brachyantha TaxID=4533 RepID=J3LWR5_ORYBR